MSRVFYILLILLSCCLAVTSIAHAQQRSLDELLRRGTAQLNSGEYASALVSGREISQRVPDRGEGYALMGRALASLERYSEAYSSFDKAAERGVDVSVALGTAQYQAGQTTLAERTLSEAVESNPGEAEAHYFLGLTQLRTGRFAAARQSFGHAGELNPALRSETFYLSGVAAIRLDQLDVARADLESAITAAPYAPSAASAEGLLADLNGGDDPQLQFRAGLRAEYDTNVLLVPTSRALFTAEEISGRSGTRVVVDLGGTWKPAMTDTLNAILGYGLYQSIHLSNRDVLKNFDITNHALTLGAEWKAGSNYLTLPYRLSAAFLGPLFRSDYDHFSTSHALSPLYARRFGNHSVGVSNALLFENFAEDPADVVLDDGIGRSLQRDNVGNDFSLFYAYYFNDNRGQLSPELGWLRTSAQGENNPWSHKGWHTGAQLSYRVGEHWGLGGFMQYTGRDYTHPYPLPDSNNDFSLVQREDHELSGGLEWSYDREDWAVTAAWHRIASRSTVGLFDYRRSIFSLGAEARF